MAQSNYNIPNDSAPAVRAQLNSVFESIATNNSGPTAPTTTFAHQWWYDTNQDILYKRNDTDSGWVVIAEFDTDTGKFLMPAAGLTQSQVQNPSSTDFGTVSGQRLSQAFGANEQQVGVGQTWQNVSSSRLDGVSYQNTTGKPIHVALLGMRNTSVSRQLQVSTDNSSWVNIARTTATGHANGSAIVPAGHYYRTSGSGAFEKWLELR